MGAVAAEPVAVEDLKVGAIFIGDEQEGYTQAHMIGVEGMMEALGLSSDQVILKTNIPDDNSCYDAAVDLAEQGCQIIFANSFGHEDYMIQAASEYPDIQFCHATGYQAATCGLDNVHNYFTAVYESRYVSGVVAGLKLMEILEGEGFSDANYNEDGLLKIGYVGAKPFAEVISGMTAFFLGVRSVCPDVAMDVKFTGEWGDQALEKEAAEALISSGCVLLSQHSDTTGPAAACEAAKVWHVGYNVGMLNVAPNYSLTSSSIKWAPYYTYAVNCVVNGEDIVTDWCQGYSEDSVCITELNDCVAKDTQAKVDATWAAIADGSLHVFDTDTWTVDGKKVESTVDIEGYYGLEYINEDGYFMESELASAPSFAFIIDGITVLE